MNINLLTPSEFRKKTIPAGSIHPNTTFAPTFSQKTDQFQLLFSGDRNKLPKKDDKDTANNKRRRESTASGTSVEARVGFSPGKRQGSSQYQYPPDDTQVISSAEFAEIKRQNRQRDISGDLPDDTQVLSGSFPYRPSSRDNGGHSRQTSQSKMPAPTSSPILPKSPTHSIASSAMYSPTPLPETPKYRPPSLPASDLNQTAHPHSYTRPPYSNQDHARRPESYGTSVISTAPSLTSTKLRKPLDHPLYTLFISQRYYNEMQNTGRRPWDLRYLSTSAIEEKLHDLRERIREKSQNYTVEEVKNIQDEVAASTLLHDPERPSSAGTTPELKYSELPSKAKPNPSQSKDKGKAKKN